MSIIRVLQDALAENAKLDVQAVLKSSMAAAKLSDGSEAYIADASRRLVERTNDTLPFLQELQAAAQVAEATGQSLASVAKAHRAAELSALARRSVLAATSGTNKQDPVHEETPGLTH
jgi:hypothetical protein